MNSDQDVLAEFEKITQKNLRLFLEQALLFLRNDRPTIVAYYNGTLKIVDSVVFQKFNTLQLQLITIFEIYHLNSNSFNNLKWWDLLDILEQIDSSFASLKNAHRWSRSSLSKFGFDPNIQINYTLQQNQTLERVSQDILLQNDPNNQWYDIAQANDLTEEDYTIEGGVELQLSFPRINRGINIQSVMDVMIGKKIYGIDLHKKITIVTDSNNASDLLLLDYDQTVQQSVEILTLLKQNSNPDFPNEGLQSTVVVGKSRALLNFPIIIRQMQRTFATDDSLINFLVTNLAYEQDNLLISYNVQTRLNETNKGKTVL